MNSFFIVWYYTLGLGGLFLAVGNSLHALLHHFNILGLLGTLISPWKRDVAVRDWLGFHPLRSLQALAENLMARFLGMMVRLSVLGVGLTALFLGFGVGIAVLVVYVAVPIVMIGGVITLFMNPLLGAGLCAVGGVCLIIAYASYLSREQEEPNLADLQVLQQLPWFDTLLGRPGLNKKDLDRGVLRDTDAFLAFLLPLGIDRAMFERAVELEYQVVQTRARQRRFFSWENLKKGVPIGKGWHYAYTPHLDRYALDLSSHDPTEYAHATLIGRQEEFKMTTLVLERPSQNCVLLVGDPGIGKQVLIHQLARLIRQNVFEGTPLGDARVLVFDIGRVVSDAINRGDDIDGTVRWLLGEAAYAGNVILVIENIDTILGDGTVRHSLAPVLGEFLSLPGFRLIGTVATTRYHALTKTDDQLFRFFEVIFFHETTEEETLLVLLDYVRPMERKRTVFTLPGLLAIIAQASRYKWEVPFPERALDLAQEVLTYWQGSAEERYITPKTVEAFVTLKTGMPTGVIGDDEKDKLLRLEEFLHERVIGQDEAVKQVAEAMRRARAGFGDAKRPLGSFIFLGPTGVGKTETVKAFAECYFGSEDRMIRLDMSEFQTSEAVARLIGSEALGQTGQLTDMVKEKPFSILLLDELEKAYPKALDIFLQILDEGYVTDSAGEKISFRNTIIIATSNAGAPIIKAGIDSGLSFPEIRKRVLDYVVEQGIYRLEFLNRFDGVIFFESLKHEELLQVTEMKLRVFADRLKKEKNISITFAPGVAEKIVEQGYEPEFGARSINRYIEDTIEDAVISQVIVGSVSAGDTLSVTADDLS